MFFPEYMQYENEFEINYRMCNTADVIHFDFVHLWQRDTHHFLPSQVGTLSKNERPARLANYHLVTLPFPSNYGRCVLRLVVDEGQLCLRSAEFPHQNQSQLTVSNNQQQIDLKMYYRCRGRIQQESRLDIEQVSQNNFIRWL